MVNAVPRSFWSNKKLFIYLGLGRPNFKNYPLFRLTMKRLNANALPEPDLK